MTNVHEFDETDFRDLIDDRDWAIEFFPRAKFAKRYERLVEFVDLHMHGERPEEDWDELYETDKGFRAWVDKEMDEAYQDGKLDGIQVVPVELDKWTKVCIL